MRKTFSWSCASCGEYNVAELGVAGAAELRCEFCLRAVRAAPSLEERPARLSDDWLGGTAIGPISRPGPDDERRR